MTATATCTVHGPTCERVHVGDRVQVVLDPGQLGYGSTGTVIAITQWGDCVVEFDTPVTYTYGNALTNPEVSVYTRLNYSEHELEKLAS